jgi:hypothetical protein
LHRRIAGGIRLEIEPVAPIVAIDAVTGAVGVTVNNAAGVTADRRTLRVCVAGILGETRQSQHSHDHQRTWPDKRDVLQPLHHRRVSL